MLSFAIEYRKALEYITSDLKNDLHKYELTDAEWQIAVELKNMLKVSYFIYHLSLTVTQCCKPENSVHYFNWQLPFNAFPLFQILKDGTEFFSHGTPNLATVILAMDHIDMTFTNAIKPDSKAHPAISYALHLAKKTLNKYYSLTDEADVYRIAMGKHYNS